jgi:hypothetical protein
MKSEIKPFKEVLPEKELVHRLRVGTFKRDSLVQVGNIFFRNEKEYFNFHQFYNTNK